MNPTSQSAQGVVVSNWVNREHATGDNHRCNSCASRRKVEFLGEVCLHFLGGLESLGKPLVWVFPRVVVCLHCGFAHFRIPESELGTLAKGDAP